MVKVPEQKTLYNVDKKGKKKKVKNTSAARLRPKKSATGQTII
jgi:hypothetical protein